MNKVNLARRAGGPFGEARREILRDLIFQSKWKFGKWEFRVTLLPFLFFQLDFNFENKNSVVLITHAGTIRAILSHILEIEPDKSIGIEISHLSCTIIEVINKNNHNHRGGRYRLLRVNQQII